MNKLLPLILLSVILASCGQREEELLDPSIENDVVMRAQLEFRPLVEQNEDPERKITYLTYRTLDPTAPLETLDSEQKFVCALKKSIDSINSGVQRERSDFIDLHDKLVSGVLTADEEESITELLMKYRMVHNLKYFYPSTKYTSVEITNKLSADTKRFIDVVGLPTDCKYTVLRGDDTFHLKARLSSDECRQAFLRRAQVIPSGLAISQAALESAWGTSRFAEQGKNLFGLQLTFSSKAEVLKRPLCIPSKENPKVCVYKFVSVNDGIKEYFRLLNAGTYQSYFREYRGSGEVDPTSCSHSRNLIDGLVNYAEEGNYKSLVHSSMNTVCPLIENCP